MSTDKVQKSERLNELVGAIGEKRFKARGVEEDGLRGVGGQMSVCEEVQKS